MTKNVRREIAINSDRFRTEQTVNMRTGMVVSIELIDNHGKIPTISFTDPSELYEYWCAIENEFKINNPLDNYNKPLNCTDLSKEPPYNPTFKIVDDYLVEYDGDYFDLHKPSNIRSMIRIMNRIINGDVE